MKYLHNLKLHAHNTFYCVCYLLLISCNEPAVHLGSSLVAVNSPGQKALVHERYTLGINDLQPAKKGYTSLEYDTMEQVISAPGTKSVLFSNDGSRLYAMNLERMSIY